jgi:hypothetical protein
LLSKPAESGGLRSLGGREEHVLVAPQPANDAAEVNDRSGAPDAPHLVEATVANLRSVKAPVTESSPAPTAPPSASVEARSARDAAPAPHFVELASGSKTLIAPRVAPSAVTPHIAMPARPAGSSSAPTRQASSAPPSPYL